MNAKQSVRRLVFRAEKLLQAARFGRMPVPPGGWPILLGVSFPKSGTHLLDQILLGFAKVGPFSQRLHSFYAEYEGESGRSRSVGEALAWLESLDPGDVASAHLFARPEVCDRVARRAFLPYFIFRDPRDVVVSHVFYVAEMESRHVHHAFYASLPDFDARLRTSILGRPELEIDFPNIAERFAPYLGWLDHPEVLKLQFEDLVNDRQGALQAISRHFLDRVPLNLPPARVLAALERAINPRRSPTFRSGKTGEWRKYFTSEHKRIFRSVAGDLLHRLGYEKGDDW